MSLSGKAGFTDVDHFEPRFYSNACGKVLAEQSLKLVLSNVSQSMVKEVLLNIMDKECTFSLIVQGITIPSSCGAMDCGCKG